VGVRRGIGLVVALLLAACLVSVAGIVALWFLVGRGPSVAANSTLVLKLNTDLSENPPEDVVRTVLGAGNPRTLRTIIDDLRKAKVDKRIGAVLIVPGGLRAQFWGKIQELRDAILDYRRSGKPAIAYVEYGDDRVYYLASACDRVFLMPSSQLDLNGLASYELFLRGTLDKIGAYPDFLHMGEFKTAANQFTETGFTPAHREMIESINRDMFEQLVRGIADGRRKPEAEVRALIDQGPFLARDAVKAGLVDGLAYPDQLDDKVKVPGGKLRRLDDREYAKVSPASLGLNKGPRIALIYASGVIVSGESGFDPVNGPVLGSDTLIKYIRQAREDSRVKAIVLRVDSPGGSAVASDSIWRELMLTRTQKPARPLVVSMSDLAASGGYYISMPASYIVAEPATLTGSIGVITGKIVTGGTLEKIGAHMESVSIGRNAEMNSPIRPFNDSERAKVQAGIAAFYDIFVEKAAQSRHMPPARLEALARGRVWTGRQAKQNGLVDELGGLDRALAAAKQRAGLAPDAEVELVTYPPKRTIYEIVAESLRSENRSSLFLSLALSPEERQAIAVATTPVRLFRRGETLALMPYTVVR
jgi:protease-4